MSERRTVVVLNGSPKGEVSVTYQYVRWLAKARPDLEFDVIHAAQRVERIERGGEEADRILEKLAKADLVLLATPVYICLVPSQYQRFLEWLGGKMPLPTVAAKRPLPPAPSPLAERGSPLRAAVITTSVHFNDHIARDFLQEAIRMLNWEHAGSFTSGMHDLLNPKSRVQLETFLKHALDPAPAIRGAIGKDVVLLAERADGEVFDAVEAFAAEFPEGYRPERLLLEDFELKTGCQGCLRCGTENECTHHGRDRLAEMSARLRRAKAVVVAASLRHGMLNWRWKQLVDRLFHHNHVPLFEGLSFGFVLSGDLPEAAPLRAFLRTYVGYGRGHLTGIVSGTGDELGRRVRALGRETARTLEDGYCAPPSFESIAGHKVIRDALWSGLRRVYPAEHAHWKGVGLYDFPRYGLRARVRDWVLSLPWKRKSYQEKLGPWMVEPFKKLFD